MQCSADRLEDIVELLVGLNLAVAECELAMNERPIDLDLKGAQFPAGVRTLLDGNFPTVFSVQRVRKSVCNLRVASAGSALNLHEHLGFLGRRIREGP